MNRHVRRSRRLIHAAVLVGCVLASVQQSGLTQSAPSQDFTGTWTGTWDGSGSGEFELTLTNAGGKPGGKVAVTTDAGNYAADLRDLSFDGSKMTAAYDFPLDPSSEVLVTATFDARTAKGTWTLRPKGQTTEIASGTWTVSRK